MHGGAGAGRLNVWWRDETECWTGGCWKVIAVLSTLPSFQPFQLSAQDTSHIVLPADTMRPGVRPNGRFWRSFLLPGWGRRSPPAHDGRGVRGVGRGDRHDDAQGATGSAIIQDHLTRANLRLKRQEVPDWLVLWIFNHMLSGAEAYVSATCAISLRSQGPGVPETAWYHDSPA